MKTMFTLIALSVALTFNGFAQQSGDTEQKRNPEQIQVLVAKRQTEQLKERLKLDAEQEKSIGDINLKYAGLRAKVLELAKIEKDIDIRARMSELNEKRENEILPFLNNDQKATYNATKKEQQERRAKMQENAEQRRLGTKKY